MGSPSDSPRRAGRNFTTTDPSSTQEMPIPPLSRVIPLHEDDGLGGAEEEEAYQEAYAEQATPREEMAQGARAAQQQPLPGGYAPPAPMGGRPVWAAYYFTVVDPTSGAEITVSREVMIPADAIVECRGNALIIHHEGVADTFRIGRVRPA